MKPEILKAFPSDVSSVISKTFDLMGICEEEIVKGKCQYRKNVNAVARVDRVFGAAEPGVFTRYTNTLYRAHVRELCNRAAKDEDVRLATKAEIVVALCEGSLLAPLNQQHTALYEDLFFDIFGKYVGEKKQRVHEPWEKATAELLRTLRQKFAQKNRKLSEPRSAS